MNWPTKYKIEYTPTLLIDPDHVHIRWLGAPLGREIEPFFQVLNMVGHQKSGLGDQALKILKSIGEPRQIKIFVSLTCPYCPQEVRNAIQAAVERPDIISLEIIDVEAVPELADKYNAFGTPIVYANEKLIAKGAQPEELFMISLKKLEEETIFIPDNDAEQIETDLVIVGGGPAGLTAGIYAARSGLKSVVVEKGALGGQVATTPVVENYPGLTKVGGKALVDIMVAPCPGICQHLSRGRGHGYQTGPAHYSHHQPPAVPDQGRITGHRGGLSTPGRPWGRTPFRPGSQLLQHLRRPLIQGTTGNHRRRR